ncbi:MAG: serine--tRNA ligase [Patescibacteria group bacterium]
MLDIKFIREHAEDVKQMVKNRNKKVDVDRLLKLDKERRELISEIDNTRAEQKKAGEGKDRDLEKLKKLKGQIKEAEEKLMKIQKDFDALLPYVPNMPLQDVPVGSDENDNEVVRTVGKPPKFNFQPKDHQELGEALGIIDIERATKISGNRFCYLKGGAARLQMALIQYVYDITLKQDFVPIVPPVIVKRETAANSGHPETVGDEAYHLDQDDMFLVGTSEQSILPMYRDEILDETALPVRYLGYSTCFRREAGSYGKDMRGILRQHQFDKLEMFVFCKPQDSQKEHELLLSIEEKLMQGLDLPYRVVKLCTGDIGYPSAKTYDIETWIPSQDKYRETHSTSNCTDYQTRNLNIKYRTSSPVIPAKAGIQSKNGGTEYVHALNGTAFAIGRIIIAIMENYQQEDGSILVPKVLQKYCGIKKILK